MHSEFRRWHELAAVELDESRLSARWAALEQVRATWHKDHSQNIPLALDLARVALGLSSPNTVTALLAPIATGRALEDQLAVAVLLLLLLGDQKSGAMMTALAYALTCAAFEPASRLPVTQLLSTARVRLSEEAVRLRRRSPLPALVLPVRDGMAVPATIGIANRATYIRNPPSNQEQWVQFDLLEQGHLAPWIAAVSQAQQETKGYLNDVARQLEAFAADVHATQRLPEERLDMITWLHGGFSLSRQVPLEALPPSERILPAARELADLTQILPGPYAAPALLHQVLGNPASDATITVQESLQSHPLEWLKVLPRNIAPADLSPVLHLLTTVCENVRESSLPRGQQALAEHRVHPTRLALQIYEELLLGRLLSGSTK